MTEKKKINERIKDFLGFERWNIDETTLSKQDECSNNYIDRDFLIEKYKTKFHVHEQNSTESIRL